METSQVAGLILAGGRGSRMDDADKGCALLNGRPMVEHVAGRFRPQVGALLISANRNLARYAEYGEVVTDDPAHGAWQGPLAGVAAGLAAARTPWLATAPCDVPFLPADLVARLGHALAQPSAGQRLADGLRQPPRLAVACTGGRRQPVCMLLSRDLLPDLLQYLAEGGRKVDTWQSRVGCVEVPFDDQADAFMNVNTAGELSRASRYDSQWPKS
jgi:molybdopterin-guanine dinucleotide biosynthesis protein A